jgi:hypothetical protein
MLSRTASRKASSEHPVESSRPNKRVAVSDADVSHRQSDDMLSRTASRPKTDVAVTSVGVSHRHLDDVISGTAPRSLSRKASIDHPVESSRPKKRAVVTDAGIFNRQLHRRKDASMIAAEDKPGSDVKKQQLLAESIGQTGWSIPGSLSLLWEAIAVRNAFAGGSDVNGYVTLLILLKQKADFIEIQPIEEDSKWILIHRAFVLLTGSTMSNNEVCACLLSFFISRLVHLVSHQCFRLHTGEATIHEQYSERGSCCFGYTARGGRFQLYCFQSDAGCNHGAP